jgi:hypothetical protein
MVLAYGCIKMSIVAFYRRLFVVDKRSMFGIVTFVTQIVLVLWSLSFILLVIFPCGTHFGPNWSPTGDQLTVCPVAFNSKHGLIGSDLILDVYIFFLSLPSARSLLVRYLSVLADFPGAAATHDASPQADGNGHIVAGSNVSVQCISCNVTAHVKNHQGCRRLNCTTCSLRQASCTSHRWS